MFVCRTTLFYVCIIEYRTIALILTFFFSVFPLYLFVKKKRFWGGGPSVLKFSSSSHLYEDNVNELNGGGYYCCFIVDRSYENADVIFLFIISEL